MKGVFRTVLPGGQRQAADHRGVDGAGVTDPFRILGLPARADLADGEVHAAWRRIASATHPDREDGGDPPRFAAAAAAYTVLRTRSGRGEALADLLTTPPAAARPGLAGRVTRGRPLRLALRTLIAAAASAGAVAAAGPHPAAPALVTGIVTWLVLTGRHDLAPASPPEPAEPTPADPSEPAEPRSGFQQ